MLWTPGNTFHWSTDNFGSTYSDAGVGTNSPGHANANTKGAQTTILSALAEDCYGLAIGFSGGNTAATVRRNLVDVLIDPAGGTSWSVLISNLYCWSASLLCGGYWYYFPLYLKAGTSVGTANQSVTGSTSALRVLMRAFGKPSRPELVRCGTKVATMSAVTSTTSGQGITPGNAALGSWANPGITVFDTWWWQVGIGFNDTNIADGMQLIDVAAGDSSNKVMCMENVACVFNNSEQAGKDALGSRLPVRDVPTTTLVYARAAGTAAPETTPTVIVYGLGG